MSEYTIRKATITDADFIAEVIINAEKSNSNVLSFSTLFGVDEQMARKLIVSMLEEEIEGCEFSIDSYLIVESDNTPVAAFGAWIEGFNETPPSKIIKSNLFAFYFGIERIQSLKQKAEIIRDVTVERESGTLQFEYLYISKEHRGKGLANLLIEEHVKKAVNIFPALEKAQVQMYGNNIAAIRTYEKSGFTISKSFISFNNEILLYLPYSEKILMEKHII